MNILCTFRISVSDYRTEHMFIIYDMFEVARPSPMQQYHMSKQKCTSTGTMEKIPKDKNMMSYRHIRNLCWGEDVL